MSERVSYQEQIQQGLTRPKDNFVPALRSDVLPPIKPIPNAPIVVDAYAQHLPQPVQQVVKSETSPITRAKAHVIKTNAVTVFMAILTGATMLALQWYPPDAHSLLIFAIWIGVTSLEWIATFWLLAILDYKEQPAALMWFQMKNYVRFMRDEQEHRLRAMYPLQYDENGRRKW